MRTFIIKRLLYAIPTMLGIITITFLLSRLSPGDPVRLYTFGDPNIRPEDIQAIREHYGLHLPLHEQYVFYLLDVLTLDFGRSILYHTDSAGLIFARMPNTIQLALAALFLQLTVGVPMGILAALNRGKIIDQITRVFSTVGHAVPDFWMGLIFILVFAVSLRIMPSQGMLTIGKDQWDLLDRLKHIVMPATVLALSGIAFYMRLLRTETLDVIRQDYIRTAEAKGLPSSVVVGVHALRNALIPVVTALGGILAGLVGGALVIEQVFTWPGLGQFTFQAAIAKDYPVVQAGVIISSMLLVISYILRDITYALVDPRIKVS
ncbi:MAG TPA: ABC transporter permease [Candidatus Limnocylindrales bacterium]|nr:ABC transporter permease [Candidatus Limnocylindrales bacterium]